MSRVVPIPSSHLTPYRVVIILRLIILAFFLQFRITHPVKDAYPLWLTSVICEIWFALSWILDQFPKWYPINRETYLDRLALRLVRFSVKLLYVYFCCHHFRPLYEILLLGFQSPGGQFMVVI